MKQTKHPALPDAVRGLAKTLINNTPDGDIGYNEAANTVSEIWDQFDANGAVVGDLEHICGFIRWAKCEGFGLDNPIA
jgi:hypothetical protein